MLIIKKHIERSGGHHSAEYPIKNMQKLITHGIKQKRSEKSPA